MTTAADFKIADVLAWARTKPADEEYDYWSCDNCVLAQFAKERGLPTTGAGGFGWYDAAGHEHEIIPRRSGVAASDPHTFGAFAKRLEALVPETVIARSDWSRLDAYLTDIETVEA